jgi:succinate dehydrogenase hydrophobic anchor subunit
MSALSAKMSGFLDGLFYRGREGHLSFLGHRLAGLGTLLFLTTHIVDTGWAYFWPAGYGHAIELYQSAPAMVGEILLVAAVLFHGVNGLKIIISDFFPSLWNKGPERGSFYKVATLTFVLWLPAAWLMLNSFLTHLACEPNCVEKSTADIAARTNASLIATPVIFIAVLAVLLVGAQIKEQSLGSKRLVKVPARNFETIGWSFMRWSGVLLIPLVWGHVLLQDVLVGVHSIDLDYVALRWGMTLWQVYDIALLAFGFAHGVNGLRAVAEDYIHHKTAIRVTKWILLIAWLGITIYGGAAIVLSAAVQAAKAGL